MSPRTVAAPGRLRAAVLGLLTLLALLVTDAVTAPVALAKPCTTCPEEPQDDPGPPKPPGPVVKHRLTIKNIVVHDINDDDKPLGHELSDEVYITVRGERVWGEHSVDEFRQNFDVDVSRDLAGSVNAYLGGIEIWDDDDTSADDRLGTLSVYGNGSSGELTGTYSFKRSDSHYTMEIGLRQL
jgi:hypothetical protein